MYVRFCLNMHKETTNSGDLEETERTAGGLRDRSQRELSSNVF